MNAVLLWVEANPMQALAVWAVVHAVAQSVAAKANPTSLVGKIAHVWCAVNPLDVVKAVKTIGEEFVPPTGGQ